MFERDIALEIERRFGLFAEEEGVEDAGGGEPAPETETADEGADEAVHGDDEAQSWRDAIKDADARKFAESSTDIEHLAKRGLEMRQKLARAIVQPGKDADEKEIAAYRKALGVPDAPDAYLEAFPKIEDITETQEAVQKEWAETFHGLNVPAETAAKLIEKFQEQAAAEQQALIEADAEYARENEAALRKEWGSDYEDNLKAAARAKERLFGDEYDEIKTIETKDGRFIMDDARLIRAMARLGREMQESDNDTVSDAERETLDEQIDGLQKERRRALSNGDRGKANKLHQEIQNLIAKRDGAAPVVGAQGRAA